MASIEDDLISNKLPYPQYYDGEGWNTIVHTDRKSMPTYLKRELPSMKFRKIKQKFQQMDRFAPPEITYFERMIKPPRKTGTSLNKSNRVGQSLTLDSGVKVQRQRFSSRKQRQADLDNVREELKYALIMTDRKSDILVNLLQKAVKLEKEVKKMPKTSSFEQKLVKGKKSQSLQLGCQTQECFRNTVDIVFSMKKKQFFQHRSSNPEKSIREDLKEKIESIRLMTYSDGANHRK